MNGRENDHETRLARLWLLGFAAVVSAYCSKGSNHVSLPDFHDITSATTAIQKAANAVVLINTASAGESVMEPLADNGR